MSSTYIQGWLASEEAQRDVIAVKRVYIDICDGNLYDALILSQMIYWHPRLTVERDGHKWLVKSMGDWWDECRVDERTARRAVNRLEKLGLIYKKVWKYDGSPTTHTRLNLERFEELVKFNLPERSNGNDLKGQFELPSEVKTITKTTTKTTTKTEKNAHAKSAKPTQAKRTVATAKQHPLWLAYTQAYADLKRMDIPTIQGGAKALWSAIDMLQDAGATPDMVTYCVKRRLKDRHKPLLFRYVAEDYDHDAEVAHKRQYESEREYLRKLQSGELDNPNPPPTPQSILNEKIERLRREALGISA